MATVATNLILESKGADVGLITPMDSNTFSRSDGKISRGAQTCSLGSNRLALFCRSEFTRFRSGSISRVMCWYRSTKQWSARRRMI